MNKRTSQLWVNSICAVIKSDLNIRDEEIAYLSLQLQTKKLRFLDFGIETDELFNEIIQKLYDASMDAEEHFQCVKMIVLKMKVNEHLNQLSELLQLCSSIAFQVNQFSKKELVMLSRLEQEFKKF
jgi:hypothetical protein